MNRIGGHSEEVSLLTRLFALFAFLFGLPYLTQGLYRLIAFDVSGLIAFDSGQRNFFLLQIQLAIILFDLLIGGASIFIGAGLFFRKEWARKAWLIFVIITLLVGLHLTAMQFFAGYSGLARVYGWIGLLIFVSTISLVYLSKAPIKARFH